MKYLGLLLVLSAFAGCANCGDGATTASPDAAMIEPDESQPDGGRETDASVSTSDPQLVLQFGDDVPAVVRERVEAHLRAAATRPVVSADASAVLEDLHEDTLILGFGDVSAARFLISEDTLQTLGAEGYALKSGTLGEASVLVVDGSNTPWEGEDNAGATTDEGVKFGAYALLEELGFAFLHPLEPLRPPSLPLDAPDVDVETAPRWRLRGLQLHTMHPLELTDLLNGWGPEGPDDGKGWNEMLPDWDEYLEWSLANGQNHVHWVLLAADTWRAFASSQLRMDRLATLVDRAHAFGIRVGVDVPIRLQQQHSWRMIEREGTLEEESQQIRDRVDLLMEAGFDYLATESGNTEFTAPDDQRMLAWMDVLAIHMAEEHGKPVFIKIHSSTGQTVENFTDPDTGEPLNFNFLPHYADERLGVMPHTVQHYALDDPAPTYGNTDFAYMREFLQEEVGRRPTVWHPETAYWVSFDVDVPLFLPVYAHTRVRDLRLLAADEVAGRMGRGEHAGKMMDGQFTFSSGWEWGYWVQEVVTARAAWNPRIEIESDADATRAMMEPVTRPFGPVANEAANLITEYALAQQDLLIDGIVNGQLPAGIERKNGQAYLQGVETWDDIADLAAEWLGMHEARTQPDKYGMVEMRTFFDNDIYPEEIDPLLEAMETKFTDLYERLAALRPQVPEHALPLFDDILDAAHMTMLRARQVHALYDYVDLQERGLSEDAAAMRLERARGALDDALTVVAKREQQYRVPADRIAGWRANPTAYNFTYLWTVRTLFYWWRDEAKAVLVPRSPCYMNIINPVTVAFGEGDYSKVADIAAEVFDEVSGLGDLTECLGAPTREPQYPPEGLRP